MTGAGRSRADRRYWSVVVLLPFVAIFLAMAAYAAVHGQFGVLEGSLADGIAGPLLEAVAWAAAVLVPEYLVLYLVYRLDAGVALRTPLTTVSCSVGTGPAALAGIAGFFAGFMLGRALYGGGLFTGPVLAVFVVLAALQGQIAAPLADLGEAKRLERRAGR